MATVITATRSTWLERDDRIRLTFVTFSEVMCILGTMFGVGVFGGPQVAQAAGGALSAEATLIAPAVPAFSIWSVIYAGLAAYTVWQWLPSQRTSPRHRSIGFLVAASMLLNGAWLLIVQAGRLWGSVVVIVALVVVLGLIIQRLAATPSTSKVDVVVTDGTFGLYVGWVAVATCANITAALVAQGVDPAVGTAEVWAAVVLVVALLVALVLLRVSRANVAIAAAMAWGIGWIAVARLTGLPSSTMTGVVAAIVAGIILLVGVGSRVVLYRRRSAPA